MINRYFAQEQQLIDELHIKQETLQGELTELEEEHGGEEGALGSVANKAEANSALDEYIDLAWSTINSSTYEDYKNQNNKLENNLLKFEQLKTHPVFQNLKNARGNIVQKTIINRLKQDIDTEEKQSFEQYIKVEKTIKELRKEIKALRNTAISEINALIDKDSNDEYLLEITIIRNYLTLNQDIADIKKAIREAEAKLDADLLDFYPTLTEEQIKQLVVDDKWMATIEKDIHSEMDRISQRLTQRIKELAERYETPMPKQTQNVIDLENSVNGHLAKMGFVWN